MDGAVRPVRPLTEASGLSAAVDERQCGVGAESDYLLVPAKAGAASRTPVRWVGLLDDRPSLALPGPRPGRGLGIGAKWANPVHHRPTCSPNRVPCGRGHRGRARRLPEPSRSATRWSGRAPGPAP